MLFDRYLFRQWLVAFGLCFGAVVGLLLIGEVSDNLPDFLEAGQPAAKVAAYFLLLIPGYLPTVLPFIFLVSVLFCLSNLHRGGEITAMRAGGSSLLRIARPIWAVSGTLALLLFWMNDSIIPRTSEWTRQTLQDARSQSGGGDRVTIPGRARAMGVSLVEAGELWQVEAFDARQGKALGAALHRLSDGREWQRVEAASARYQAEEGTWVFSDGRLLEFAEQARVPSSVSPFSEKTVSDSPLTPALLVGLSQRPKDLSLRELRGLLREDLPESLLREYRLRYYTMLVIPLQLIIAAMLAIPFSSSGPRTNPALGISSAIFCFLLFFLLAETAFLIGERGAFTPMLAAAVPLAIAIPPGLWLNYRRR